MINFSFYSINSVIFQSLYLFYGVNQSNKKGFLVKVAFRGHTSLYKINSRLSLRRYLHHQSRLILQHPTMVFFSIYIFSHSYSYWSVPKFWIWCTFLVHIFMVKAWQFLLQNYRVLCWAGTFLLQNIMVLCWASTFFLQN